MRRNELSDRYYNNLTCKIFVMGHATQGESIAVILYDGVDVVYSCIVDAFVANDRIVPKELLHGLGITQITELFWTHPHEDHSDGIAELIDEFTPLYIYIANELHTIPSKEDTTIGMVLSKINSFRGYDKRCKNQPKVLGISTNSYVRAETLRVGTKFVDFEIFTVAPPDGIVRKKSIDGNYRSPNDYSVVLSMNIGDFSVLLTGDIQDRIIEAANEDLFRNIPVPNLLKIPHHGSIDSVKILDLFETDESIDIGITTAKKSSFLPRQEALDIYCSRCAMAYRIDPTTSCWAIWGIEVDVIAGTATEIRKEAFVRI